MSQDSMTSPPLSASFFVVQQSRWPKVPVGAQGDPSFYATSQAATGGSVMTCAMPLVIVQVCLVGDRFPW